MSGDRNLQTEPCVGSDYTIKMIHTVNLRSPIDLLQCPIAFLAPRRLTDISSWHFHFPFAFFLTDLMRPRVFGALGSHKGDSYCAFCQAFDVIKIPCSTFAVDTWKGDKHAGQYGDNVLVELRRYHDPLYSHFSTLVKSTFDDALSHFADK